MKKWTKVVLLTLGTIIVLPVVGLLIAGALPDSDRMVASVVLHQKPEPSGLGSISPTRSRSGSAG
jgi:hypothetical protein